MSTAIWDSHILNYSFCGSSESPSWSADLHRYKCMKASATGHALIGSWGVLNIFDAFLFHSQTRHMSVIRCWCVCAFSYAYVIALALRSSSSEIASLSKSKSTRTCFARSHTSEEKVAGEWLLLWLSIALRTLFPSSCAIICWPDSVTIESLHHFH